MKLDELEKLVDDVINNQGRNFETNQVEYSIAINRFEEVLSPAMVKRLIGLVWECQNAMNYYNAKRTMNKKGLTIPS